jgi:hypothetical protein
MLRASAEASNAPLNLMAIPNPSLDPLLPGGRELLAFTTALVARDDQKLEATRSNLAKALGSGAVAAAAGAAGNFQMMNRLLDATGVPQPTDRSIEAELGLDSNWAH